MSATSYYQSNKEIMSITRGEALNLVDTQEDHYEFVNIVALTRSQPCLNLMVGSVACHDRVIIC
jgi:hypothetical protein